MQHMQAAYIMPAMPQEGAYSHDMMSGMHGMHVMMGPMGPMLAAGPMPGGMVPAGMAAPQLTQMLVEAARGGRSSNVFFKTRICNKWRAGSCPYGDKCTYAHGEHELRYVPPEIVSQLEAQQKLQEAAAHRHGGADGTPRSDDAGLSPGMPGAAALGPHSFYKTRLCIKYMQTGYCHKGAGCTFAHGYEDLRQPGTPLSPGRMQQDPMSPGRMSMGPQTMMMSPAAMMGASMGMSHAGMAGGRGMHAMPGMPPGATAAMMGGMQMGMAMPHSPGGRYQGGGQQPMQRSPRAGGGMYGGGRDDPAAAARRRASAMCQIAGVGEAGSEELLPSTMNGAMADVRSGNAVRENPYADSVAEYVHAGGPGNS